MLAVPKGFEHRRLEVIRAVITAVDIVRDFADRHGWSSSTLDPFFRAVELYDSQQALWRRILELNALEDAPLPTDALTAALEEGVLLAVFREQAEQSRPEYFRTFDDWTRALAHELVHRLHVRILQGNEDAMGPQWFYEALAVIGSGQALGVDREIEDVDEALRLSKTTGRGSYAEYAAALRFFARRIPLPRLVEKAADPDFEAWLRSEAIADPKIQR
jgi:hypothetical protein